MSSYRRRARGQEHTHNHAIYVVKFTLTGVGARTMGDFTTRDRAQAYRRARSEAAAGTLLAFTHHQGNGRTADLLPEVQGGAR
ncbi:hypothetical protein AB0465_11490 [Streptomyces griseoviridis]|uniref:hypothetical protein n=1 Tax=Streptomyces griseoviridis TaxID=45398 RepID=UPI00344CCFBD